MEQENLKTATKDYWRAAPSINARVSIHPLAYLGFTPPQTICVGGKMGVASSTGSDKSNELANC